MDQRRVWDGNEAAAHVAHRASEVIAIYPITPSSGMGELCDEWSAKGQRNLWSALPDVVEMQSEGGAAGAVHGALQAGALTTTFTASQGLLLMIPGLYKIAGELNAFCMHVAARAVATHALSIFGDHSDVMACRQTGFAMLSSSCVQEAHDLAAVAHSATLRARVPVMHFFDGFRTSHETTVVEPLADDVLRALLDEELIAAHRRRALSPDHPVLRGSAQNPDTFFQAREAANPHYLACPGIVQSTMDRLAELTGRRYRLFDYHGHPRAERVIVAMGSGAETVRETVAHLVARGERVGALSVHLYRPFSVEHFLAALPDSARAVAVLDRTKEPGAVGEPLFLDVLAALREGVDAGLRKDEPRLVGGRYGLGSKEFTPTMVQAVLDELARPQPRRRFTLGIVDDVTGLSLPCERELDIEASDEVRALFYGLGSDGTVGANKNSIKILGEEAGLFAQGYFVYDSRKSGAVTISHLRFGPRPIRAPWLIEKARFVACHQFHLLERLDVLEKAEHGATLLLNAPFPAGKVWDNLPREMQQAIRAKELEVFAIDALEVARAAGLGGRINTVMQACFFALCDVLPREEALQRIKDAIAKSYAKQGPAVIERNCAAVDTALAHLHKVPVPAEGLTGTPRPPPIPDAAPEFVQRVTSAMLAGKGDLLPVSAFPPDGTWPTATARWEKRNLATEIPVWDTALCIQCNKCALMCPHAAIRAKVFEPALAAGAPQGFKSTRWRSAEHRGLGYALQVAPEDCTGCGLCVAVCPAKDKGNPRHKAIDMAPQAPLRAAERDNYEFFLALPEIDRSKVKLDNKGTQLLQPLFEYSGACAGCGETPYIKLLTQLFGDRALIANATGCSSIFGGNLPTTPYAVDKRGRGPAWSNSLFEDNAEFGLGMRLAIDSQRDQARGLVEELAAHLPADLLEGLLHAEQGSESGIGAQRERVERLRHELARMPFPQARRLERLADNLVHKSVWLVGGDGWAYDIGFGGLDHVLSLRRNVNVLVLDTEVYSNTGGQQSKATPLGASAKFAVAGKSTGKKDLGLIAMSYGHVYVARVAMGAKDGQAVKALLEAEAWPGPSLVIAYSHCIAHGYDMARGADQQRLAVACGTWPLYRYDPRRFAEGAPPLSLDSGPPTESLSTYMRNETRFRMVERMDPPRFKQLQQHAQRQVRERYAVYQQLAGIRVPPEADAARAPVVTPVEPASSDMT